MNHRYLYMKHSFILLYFLIGAVQSIAFGQVVGGSNANKKAQKHMEAGIQQAMGAEYEAALASFQLVIQAEPRYFDAWMFAGDICAQLYRHEEARTYFEGAINIQDDYDVSVYKKIAESEQVLMEYESAINHIQIFLDHPNIVGETRKKAERLLTSLHFAIEAVKNPVPFSPENMGANINSRYDEYFPSLAADKSVLVITRNLVDTLERPDGGIMLRRNEDFFMAYASENGWQPAFNLGRPVNSTFNEGAQNISADGRWLYYTLCNGPDGFGSCDIYYAFRNFDVWSSPENCGKRINSANWDSQPSISSDGKWLFFTSNRPGGLGGSDIWMSKMGSDGYWEEAINAGPAINTSADESSPFMHPDGVTLYFASNGHPGMGGTDLFFCKRNADLTWETPVNLGYPINTSDNEATLHVSADGATAFYSSDRGDTYGGLDIYSFPMPELLRPEPVTYVKAIVKSEKDKKPLTAQIQLFDLDDNELITKSVCNQNGEFLITLPSGKDYALFVNMEGFLFHSENFSLAEGFPEDPYLLDVWLKPVSIGEIFTLRNIFFNSGSAELLPESELELLKLFDLLNKNANMKISVNGHTDQIGAEADNKVLSEKRAKAVADYLTNNGIESDRISWKGFGESQPMASNETEGGRALNRRTEIEIIEL